MIDTLLLDAGWMGLLLLAGQLIRARSRTAQALYLPASVIAGLLGLLLGPQVAGLIPLSSGASGYAGFLVIVLFFPSVPRAFALLMPPGFVGGHGYAGAIGSSLAKGGVDGAVSVGYTFATVGLLSAVCIGVPLIKLARRRGWVVAGACGDVSPGERTGLVPPGERTSMGEATTSGGSVEALACHLAPIAASVMLGIYATRGVGRLVYQVWHVNFHLPEVATAMLCGVALKVLLGRVGLGGAFLDQKVAERIGNTATDWLVGFGLATLKLSLIASYWQPMLAMCAIGWAGCLAYLFLVAPRVNDSYWFERGIFVFGWTTGVVAMGIALLRMVDPDGKSGTLPSYGLAYSLIAPIELAMVASLPVLLLAGYLWIAGSTLLAFAAVLVLAAARLRGAAEPTP